MIKKLHQKYCRRNTVKKARGEAAGCRVWKIQIVMEKIKITEVAKAVNGRLSVNKNCFVTGVSIDSRTTNKGDIFFAIKGENYDGHNFIKSAISKGAVAAVVSCLASRASRFFTAGEPAPPKFQRGEPTRPAIVVKDTIRALQDFAGYYRRKFNVKVIGITGSNGKTTTKDILNSIISKQFPVLATQGNLNNHIGVPLTLFNLNNNHRYCVLEMGANHKGEIARLCEIAGPDCGIITNISSAHIGSFGSMKNILSSKTELFNYLNKRGVIIVNNDDKLLTSSAGKFGCNKKTFGIKNNSDVTARDITLKTGKTIFVLKAGGRKIKAEMPLCGLFNVYNALAASTCAVSLGIPVEKIVRGIKNFKPQKNRMEILALKNGIVILNDSYNANPASMRNAVENFVKMFYNKRKILVLGDMLELGRYETTEHRKLGKFLYENKSAVIVCTTGSLSKNTAETAGGKWFSSTDKLSEYLKKNLREGDAVLFKASRKIELDKVVNSLITNH